MFLCVTFRQVALNENGFPLSCCCKVLANVEEKYDSENPSTIICVIFKGCQVHTRYREKGVKFSNHHTVKSVESMKFLRDFYHRCIHFFSFLWTVFLRNFSLSLLLKALCIKLESKQCLKLVFKQTILLQTFYKLLSKFFFFFNSSILCLICSHSQCCVLLGNFFYQVNK